MPHWRFLELLNSVGQFVVHGARNQPSECTWIVVKIDLPDVFSKLQCPSNSCFSGMLITMMALCMRTDLPSARLDLDNGGVRFRRRRRPVSEEPECLVGVADKDILCFLIVVEHHFVGLAAETRFFISAELEHRARSEKCEQRLL
jgi:hypothetical protein